MRSCAGDMAPPRRGSGRADAGGGWYGKVELIQSRGFVLDDAALKDANLATPESIEANFNQIKNLNDGDINGPGNQSLGRMLEDRLSKL